MIDNMNNINLLNDRLFDETYASHQTGYQSPIVLVKKIPPSITEKELSHLFERFGEIRQTNIMKTKLYAYVEFTV